MMKRSLSADSSEEWKSTNERLAPGQSLPVVSFYGGRGKGKGGWEGKKEEARCVL